ncbi:BsaWI family type II restriction enzyme [Campylobacter lanienae]|uniref:BsaWI family type II restriction enzyme n=1 Tax=Campylobacter lanienae TaxID=75658 RepID=UPI002432F232|nr:BsaWI family type II restriction enzyme [Campylobacter lanienae]MDD5787085.1 BsaWI family type II restriction enzyme [Campylobacter lanienae]
MDKILKPHEKIGENFRKFYAKFGEDAFVNLKDFFEQEKESFYKEKIAQFRQNHILRDDAVIKARQSWVSVIGRSLEVVIEILVDNFCIKNNLKITNDKILRKTNLKNELDEVKRKILVDFGSVSLLPDGDIIIYKAIPEVKILAILSVKNSFRERYTETPYWKLKLSSQRITKHIKVFMVTPDNDDEISFKGNRKSRVVMEYELDGIYLARDKFDKSKKIKGINDLINDLKALL